MVATRLVCGLVLGLCGAAWAQTGLPELQVQTNADRTAQISVPAGWGVTGRTGVVGTEGPEGALLCGLNGIALTPAGAAKLRAQGQDPERLAMLVSEYLGPKEALPALLTWLTKTAGERVDDVRITSAETVNQDARAAVVRATFRHQRGEKSRPVECMALVRTVPVNADHWSFYLSVVWTDRDRLDERWPLLSAIYRSYRLIPQ